jgi:hypothetical protein
MKQHPLAKNPSNIGYKKILMGQTKKVGLYQIREVIRPLRNPKHGGH